MCTVKRNDYVFSRKDDLTDEEYSERHRHKALLWTAPELLRQGDAAPFYGTQKGDVYSFALIVQEILYRTLPYFTKWSDVTGKLILGKEMTKMLIGAGMRVFRDL